MCCVAKLGIKEIDGDEKWVVFKLLQFTSEVLFKGVCKHLGQVSQRRMARWQEREKGGGDAGLTFQKKIVAIHSLYMTPSCRRSTPLIV